jgi:hypothetical protein
MLAVMVYARLETPHFTFDVISGDRKSAEWELRAAWHIHQTQTGAVADFDEFDVSYREMNFDHVYRDGSPIVDDAALSTKRGKK